MYEFHGWFALDDLSEMRTGDSVAPARIGELRAILAGLGWHNAAADLHHFNGTYFLTVVGCRNRPLKEASDLDELLRWLAEHLPGSHGLLYEQSDYMPVPPGPGVYRVRVLARGQVTERLDPFLSPLRPVVED